MNNIENEVFEAVSELLKASEIKSGEILVMGCSTSEIIGSRIGTDSSPDTAAVVFEAIHSYAKEKGIYLAIQCCEHLNRAIVVEKAAVPFAETVY